MRELERTPTQHATLGPCAVVGRGRLGSALATSLREVGLEVDGPLGRGATAAGAQTVLLCVPDAEIGAAAASITPGPIVGHCSGATTLRPLAGHADAFSMHPLMTVTAEGASFAGAGCAVAGSTPRALAAANALAAALGMSAVEIADEDRAAYHAAASIASNFLVTVEAAAERLAATAGLDRAALVPLVRATVENWARLGPERALTGPVARGDTETVERQREAVTQRTPDLLPLFDALTTATTAQKVPGTVRAPGATDGGRLAPTVPGTIHASSPLRGADAQTVPGTVRASGQVVADAQTVPGTVRASGQVVA
jgi:predicted short-subunit dehydrogenase-like oxidoreductase (DUF2520 family)